jgi:serine phosphatase RsbU (regulator of sigma subunit)
MDRVLRAYATKVLFAHAAALVVILALVGFSLWVAHRNAVAELDRLAGERQLIMARQTATGIRSHFVSLAGSLRAVALNEIDMPEPSASGRGARLIERPATRIAEQVRRGLLDRLHELLGENVLSVQIVHVGREGIQTLVRAGDDTLEDLGPAIDRHLRSRMTDDADVLVTDRIELAVAGATTVGVSLVAVELREGTSNWLVAVTSIDRLGSNFIRPVVEASKALSSGRGPAGQLGAVLFDAQATVIYSPLRDQIGANFHRQAMDASFREMVGRYLGSPVESYEVTDRRSLVAGRTLEPAVIGLATVDLPDGRWWRVVVDASRADVRASVDRLFDRIVIWLPIVVGALSGVFVSTAVSMIRSRSALERLKSQSLTRELEQARQIQLNWLPRGSRDAGPIRIAAANRPASHISGDFYNWFDLDDGRVAVVIGDVSGHGLAAAFLMSTTQLLVRAALRRITDPGLAVTTVNEELCRQHFGGQFVTLVLLVIEPGTGRMQVVNAGHPPVLIRSNGVFAPLAIESQLIVGIDAGVHYRAREVALPTQSELLLYTDGLIECCNEQGVRFSLESLTERINASAATGPQAVLDASLAAADGFCGTREPDDDITVVAVAIDHDAQPASAGSLDGGDRRARSMSTL